MNRSFQTIPQSVLTKKHSALATLTVIVMVLAWNIAPGVAQEPNAKLKQDGKKKDEFVLPPLASGDFSADYDAGLEQWMLMDKGWKLVDHKTRKDQKVLSQFQKKSDYNPPHRSPRHIALIKGKSFESFQLDVKVLSTHKDYNHRDVCLFFGYTSPAEFYYVHLGKKMDPHANQIFIVNNADRTKISLTTTDGTNWDENWHDVRIVRDIKSGKIEVYFDDMSKPVMTAKDTTFGKGMIGVGSFDDTANFGKLSVKPLSNGATSKSKQ